MSHRRKRNRPRDDDVQEEKQLVKQANTLLWSLGTGLLLGGLGFIAGISNNLPNAYSLTIFGFALGAAGGAFSAWGVGWKRNKDTTDYTGKVQGWGPHGRRYDNPVLELLAEEKYRRGSKHASGSHSNEED